MKDERKENLRARKMVSELDLVGAIAFLSREMMKLEMEKCKEENPEVYRRRL